MMKGSTKSEEQSDTMIAMEENTTLDEKCPKCGNPLVMATTRTGRRLKRCSTNVWDKETRTSAAGKKMKKCSTNVWNKETRSAEGCDYVQWL